ncbi:unnamed protein product [Diplocarpon coronariae]
MSATPLYTPARGGERGLLISTLEVLIRTQVLSPPPNPIEKSSPAAPRNPYLSPFPRDEHETSHRYLRMAEIRSISEAEDVVSSLVTWGLLC